MEDPPIASLATASRHLCENQQCGWGAFDLVHLVVLTGQYIKSVVHSGRGNLLEWRYNNANSNPCCALFVLFTPSYTLCLLQLSQWCYRNGTGQPWFSVSLQPSTTSNPLPCLLLLHFSIHQMILYMHLLLNFPSFLSGLLCALRSELQWAYYFPAFLTLFLAIV